MPDDTPSDPQFEPDDTHGEPGREDSTMIAARAKVWFFDDDKTPVDFVLFVLEQYFGFDESKARVITDRIRKQGKAMVAELPAIPAEIARRKVDQAAADAGYPFKVEVEAGPQIV
ncbi:MAG: ATP-dependent Clp protease adaptor ClpS [Planctomycetes bacterium]|nr:ATP-dependent Clp protease adaptor ClpS [Planctomycetota bacterium]